MQKQDRWWLRKEEKKDRKEEKTSLRPRHIDLVFCRVVQGCQ